MNKDLKFLKWLESNEVKEMAAGMETLIEKSNLSEDEKDEMLWHYRYNYLYE